MSVYYLSIYIFESFATPIYVDGYFQIHIFNLIPYEVYVCESLLFKYIHI